MRKKLLSLCLALALCLGLTIPASAAKTGKPVSQGTVDVEEGSTYNSLPAAPVNPFTDMEEASPYYPGILWAVEQGITTGTGDGTTFSPGAPCTRAQIAVFLWHAAGKPEPKLTENQYADMENKTNAYYYKAVQWAAEMNMEMSGTFSPNDPCTRLEAMYFIWRANGSPAPKEKTTFADMEINDGGQPLYPFECVYWAVEAGITKGTGDGSTFSPGGPCTRGQIAAFLYRAAQAAQD